MKDPSVNSHSSLKDPDLNKKIQVQPDRVPDPQHEYEPIVYASLRYTTIKIRFLSYCGKSDTWLLQTDENRPLHGGNCKFCVMVVEVKTRPRTWATR
jgi:hypothetical protein